MKFRRMQGPPEVVREKIRNELRGLRSSGRSAYKHNVLLEVWGIAEYLGWKIPTDALWPTVLMMEPEFQEVLEKFSDRIYDEYGGYTEEDITSGLVAATTRLWTAIRAVEVSDTPNWYTLDHEVCKYILEAELGRVTGNDFLFPFNGFYIEFPSDLFGAFTPNHPTCYAGVSLGFFDLEWHKSNSTAEVEIIKDYLSSGGTLQRGRHLVVSRNLYKGDSTELDDLPLSFSAPLDDGKPIDIADPMLCSFDTLEQNVIISKVYKLIIGFLCMNKDLNISSKHIKKKKKRKRGGVPGNNRFDVGRFLNSRTWLVGSTVRFKSASATKKDGIHGEGSTSPFPTPVSGHLRRYRCGPRNDWHYEIREIKPFLRGGIGPAIGHTYQATK